MDEFIPTLSIEPLTSDEISEFLDKLDEAVERGDLTNEGREELIARQSDLWSNA